MALFESVAPTQNVHVFIIEDNGGIGKTALFRGIGSAHWNHSWYSFRLMILPVCHLTVAWNSSKAEKARWNRHVGWVQWNQRTTSRWTAQTDNRSRWYPHDTAMDARNSIVLDGIQSWWHWWRFESEWPQDNTPVAINDGNTDAWRKRRTWHGVPVHDAISDMRTISALDYSRWTFLAWT